MVAEVIVDLTAEQTDRVFDYAIIDGISVGDRVMVPFGSRKIEGYVVALKETSSQPADKLKSVISKLDGESALLPELVQLAVWMKKAYRCTLAACLRLLIPAQMRGGRVRPLVRKYARIKGEFDPRSFKNAPKQLELLRLLGETGESDVASLEKALPGARAVLSVLEKKGVVEVYDGHVARSAKVLSLSCELPLLTPTQHQTRVISALSGALDSGGGRFLLHGVTGSGKTEVYCHIIQRALAKGRQAIVLVPEISLTPQMVMWFRSRFGDLAAVLHSRLSPGERYDEWWRIRTGQARVVIGARSAVFAPLSDIGVIVIDEEHESSYQSEHTPRYDAREVAEKRCEDSRGVLVLGSATPKIKTYHSALRGYYTLLELRERITGRPMPQTHIVDMRKELVQGNRSIFSNELLDALRGCINRGEQAMLFINRRGYNTFISCRMCGVSLKCPECDVVMTYHMGEGMLKCHYCGRQQRPPQTCPSCGSGHIRYFGLGTERVEAELEREFPGVNILRMDYDTTSTKDGHIKILTDFREKKAQILVGTQMIAKGHDFPQVTVVGVIAVDTLLGFSDFRSAERAFCLLTQVAGRAGRAELDGHVYFQCYEPEHYALVHAARQDYRAFYNCEIERRKSGFYPPYTVLARLLSTCENRDEARIAAENAHGEMAMWFTQNPDERKYLLHMRCMEAPVNRIRGLWRWQVYLKLSAKAPGAILDRLGELTSYSPERRIELEIDPANMT